MCRMAKKVNTLSCLSLTNKFLSKLLLTNQLSDLSTLLKQQNFCSTIFCRSNRTRGIKQTSDLASAKTISKLGRNFQLFTVDGNVANRNFPP